MLESLLRRGLRRVDDETRMRLGVPSMWGSLHTVARNGFRPELVIDVGAHRGDWARRARTIFPSSTFLLVEPQAALEPQLKATGQPYAITLLGPEAREDVPFHVDHDHPTGASVLEEVTNFPRDTLRVPMQTLDHLASDQANPIMIKLDVQGFELEVLKGASRTLARTEVVLMEVALLEFNAGAPLMSDVVTFMAERGFVPYDICDGLRRSEDKALFQCDILFVAEGSALRRRRRFFDHEPP